MAVILLVLWQAHSVRPMAGSVHVALVWEDVPVAHVILAFMDSLLLDAGVRILI